ncbi:alpha/beta fold hydrolase [Streptoalloteichus hindustanus]|uniref:Pimeloyl-ACP methyl ester carboxylesterase n=1 Tax=Streptoalloteichus hindustanus TaxID=2017 RepID=A0A1M4VU55_STRHI|nr:alpha/beta hydrolase [Streptoalloteichus hindustanus]SHE72352.1 Pimeloyl-ACP methyl ester carboxylesterase [Streptoalloteichus hindustanus]
MPTPPDPATVRISGPWTHRDVSANGIRLHVAEAGDGPLVLLLHGFPEFWWSWRHQLIGLADAGFRAVAVDLRGYGDSDKPPRGYDGWTLAGDVAGLVRALGERRASLVGHGWGGLLAWTVAAMHSRLVRDVAVLAAPHPLALRRAIWRGPRSQGRAARHVFTAQFPIVPERRLTRNGAAAVERMMRAWSGPKWTVAPEFDEAVRRNREAMLVPGVAHCSLEYFRWAVRAQLRGEGRRFAEVVDRRLGVPVLRLHGALDPTMLEPTTRASAIWTGPRSDYRVLPEVGHFPHQEAPHTTSRILAEFLTASTS